MKNNSEFLLEEIGRKGIPAAKLPSIPFLHGVLHEDLQDAMSMLAFVCNRNSDEMVETFQLGLTFQFRKQHDTF